MNGVYTIFNGRVMEPELRTLPDGKSVVNVSVAVRDGRKKNAETGYNETIWVRASIWGNRAEAFAQYVKKGDSINFVGNLQYEEGSGNPRSYTRKDGSFGSSFEVTVQDWSWPSGSLGAPEASDAAPAQAESFSAAAVKPATYEADEIAF